MPRVLLVVVAFAAAATALPHRLRRAKPEKSVAEAHASTRRAVLDALDADLDALGTELEMLDALKTGISNLLQKLGWTENLTTKEKVAKVCDLDFIELSNAAAPEHPPFQTVWYLSASTMGGMVEAIKRSDLYDNALQEKLGEAYDEDDPPRCHWLRPAMKLLNKVKGMKAAGQKNIG